MNVLFYQPIDGELIIKIFNPLGQLISNYSEGFKKAGDNSFELNMKGFSNGIYILSLESGIFKKSARIVLYK